MQIIKQKNRHVLNRGGYKVGTLFYLLTDLRYKRSKNY